MSVPLLQFIPSKTSDQQPTSNEFGETPLAFAPTVRLTNGEQAVPQQYLDVERNIDNLSNVLSCISTPEGYQLFAGLEGDCLFLVASVFGKENYPSSVKVAAQTKVVYGRRWLIEETTPTSEIVQTAMLAVKKAREHEVRELLTLTISDKGSDRKRLTTPFNCHLDLPLMAGTRAEFGADQAAKPIAELLRQVRVAGRSLELIAEQAVGSKLIVEVKLIDATSDEHFPELQHGSLSVVCDEQDGSDFLHQLSKALIHSSDRFVEESISFNGFKRFSHDLCPEKIANFSYQTRNVAITDSRFDSGFADMSYRVDAAKAPAYNVGELGRQQRAVVNSHPELAGYLPRELD